MPLKKERYPANWKQLSFRIRFVDQDGKCKWCPAIHGEPHPVTGKKVVLSVSHIDHVESNMERSNLVGLCQRCHLQHDRNDNLLRRKRKVIPAIFATTIG